MPRMRGFLRSRPKVAPDEWDFVQARVDARLADLFKASGAAEASVGVDTSRDGVPEDAETDGLPHLRPEGLGEWPGGPRPAIVVAGDPGEPVGVMNGSGDVAGHDIWQLPLVDGLRPAFDPDRVVPDSPVAAPDPDDMPLRSVAARRPAARRPRTATPSTAVAVTVAAAFCPYCALVLEPAPTTGRRCTRCRQRIMVKRLDGRVFYLTMAAVAVFDAEQQRIADSARVMRERDRWLRLAATVGAPADRQAHLAAVRPTEDVVIAARALYQSTVDRAFRVAKHERDWDTAARIRRENAMLLYRLAGSPLPPPAEILVLFREGVAAELRGIAEISRDAELVSAPCCDTCGADDRVIFRIALQLRAPRLPHEGCPKGLCRCAWDLAARDRETMRRYLHRRAMTESRVAANEPTEAVPTA